jgi:hypothetical protein
VGHGELTGTVAVVRLDPTVLLAALRATAAEAHARRSARSARLVARARNGKERKEMGSKWVGEEEEMCGPLDRVVFFVWVCASVN